MDDVWSLLFLYVIYMVSCLGAIVIDSILYSFQYSSSWCYFHYDISEDIFRFFLSDMDHGSKQIPGFCLGFYYGRLVLWFGYMICCERISETLICSGYQNF